MKTVRDKIAVITGGGSGIGRSVADRAYAEFGRVDILCNNASVPMRPFRGNLDTTVDDWRFMMGINARNAILDNAPYLNTQAMEGDLLAACTGCSVARPSHGRIEWRNRRAAFYAGAHFTRRFISNLTASRPI
ncbi:hypothetical protein [Mesorhizobium sp. A556]